MRLMAMGTARATWTDERPADAGIRTRGGPTAAVASRADRGRNGGAEPPPRAHGSPAARLRTTDQAADPRALTTAHDPVARRTGRRGRAISERPSCRDRPLVRRLDGRGHR